jgi:hypothetical protein
MKTLSQNMYQAKPDMAAYTMILSLETQQQKDSVRGWPELHCEAISQKTRPKTP